ncbi:MAG: ribonuclease J, partial [Alphaproteobacteria bacterium]|nr:ribonuclease J [Alphaproteobacteria bacterium]
MSGPARFVALGGAGEIGMNLSLYGYGRHWLMVDCGVTFADESAPGIDLLMADPAFIAERRKDLVALVLTHAHEDHIGAVPYLWPRLRCPVYATAFTAALLRRKLDEVGLTASVPLHVVAPGAALDLAPFVVRYVSVTHSIPEGNALLIDTPAGTIFHTGDWKLDPEPLIGALTDEPTIVAAGERGILAMICDSTNALRAGDSGSEAAVRRTMQEVVRDRDGRVVVTCFASNVARIETVARIAAAHDRHLVPAGRSMWRTIEAAREAGYLSDMPPLVAESDAGHLPPRHALVLATGCQGEPRGAMTRIATRAHPGIALDDGDTVIFSSRIIPGNERAIGLLHNRLVSDGIEVITERDALVHVSGHPARDELARMYRWVKPRIGIPVHGEARHLEAHAELARSLGVPEVVTVANGSVVELGRGPARVVDQVPTGRLALDGGTLVAIDGEAVRTRKRLAHHGLLSAAVVVDRYGRLAAEPQLAAFGIA